MTRRELLEAAQLVELLERRVDAGPAAGPTHDAPAAALARARVELQAALVQYVGGDLVPPVSRGEPKAPSSSAGRAANPADVLPAEANEHPKSEPEGASLRGSGMPEASEITNPSDLREGLSRDGAKGAPAGRASRKATR